MPRPRPCARGAAGFSRPDRPGKPRGGGDAAGSGCGMSPWAGDLDQRFCAVSAPAKSAPRSSAWSLSGGEQQMLAIGRALMARPKHDAAGRAIARTGPLACRGGLCADPRASPPADLTILVVEQNTVLALGVAQRAYVLENGRIVAGRAGRRTGARPARRPKPIWEPESWKSPSSTSLRLCTGDPVGRRGGGRGRSAWLATEIGFFTVRGHGVPDSAGARYPAATARAFFDQPDRGEGKTFRRAPPAFNRGWGPLGEEALARSLGHKTPADLKESLSIGPIDVPAGRPTTPRPEAFPHFVPNRWPEQPGAACDCSAPDYFRMPWSGLPGTLMQLFRPGPRPARELLSTTRSTGIAGRCA